MLPMFVQLLGAVHIVESTCGQNASGVGGPFEEGSAARRGGRPRGPRPGSRVHVLLYSYYHITFSGQTGVAATLINGPILRWMLS